MYSVYIHNIIKHFKPEYRFEKKITYKISNPPCKVMTRLKQYKDDLLSSCLTFVLALPPEIVSAEMASIVPALQVK